MVKGQNLGTQKQRETERQIQSRVIATPETNERVVFIPPFLRRLGFPLHPFVCGIMFYYGLDFHDLAPNSFLHIWAFIVECVALLRIPPPALRSLAQILQHEAKGGGWGACRLRRRNGEQASQHHLAQRGFLWRL